MRRLLALGVLVAAMLGIALLWTTSQRGAEAEGARPESASAKAPERQPLADVLSPAATSHESDAARTREVQIVEPPPPPPEPDGIEEGGAVEIEGSQFAAKYVTLAPAELDAALTKLEDSVDREIEDAFRERWNDRRYVTVELGNDDEASIEAVVEAWHKPDELVRSRVVIIYETQVRELELVVLKRDQLPDLYAHIDERDWLRRFLAGGEHAR